MSRRTVRLILTVHGLIGLVDAAELIAAELVSNAVRHTDGPVELRVRWEAGVGARAGILRIGAWDADPEPPPPAGPLELVADADADTHAYPECGPALALVPARSDPPGWQPSPRHGARRNHTRCEPLTA
ncbi:ATP-binding protein [Streptomyces sp. NPDC091280]|uniref:ATP-binding protein n=1 Tax=Streptomyces sp. NPDC091280 TaxID=3365984 RepID=UPI003822FD3F